MASNGTQQIQAKGHLETGSIALVYIISIVLGIVLASPLSKLYIYLFKPNRLLSGFFGYRFDPSYLLDGFLIGYIFFLSFFIALLLKNPKQRFWVWFCGMIIFLLITLGEWKYFGFDLFVSLIGYVVGSGVAFLRNIRLRTDHSERTS